MRKQIYVSNGRHDGGWQGGGGRHSTHAKIAAPQGSASFPSIAAAYGTHHSPAFFLRFVAHQQQGLVLLLLLHVALLLAFAAPPYFAFRRRALASCVLQGVCCIQIRDQPKHFCTAKEAPFVTIVTCIPLSQSRNEETRRAGPAARLPGCPAAAPFCARKKPTKQRAPSCISSS